MKVLFLKTVAITLGCLASSAVGYSEDYDAPAAAVVSSKKNVRGAAMVAVDESARYYDYSSDSFSRDDVRRARGKVRR